MRDGGSTGSAGSRPHTRRRAAAPRGASGHQGPPQRSPTRALVPLQPSGQPLTQGRGPRHATGLEDGAGRSPRPPKPWAASDGPAVRCTVTAWPRECRGHRRPALRTGESGPDLAGRTRGRVRGEPGPRSRGALTLRRFALAVSAIYLGFTGRSASSSRRVNPLPRPRVDCTTPAEQANGPCTRTPSNTPTGAGGRGAGVSCSCGWPCSCCWRWRLRRWSSPPTGAAQLAVNPVGSCRGRYHTDWRPRAALQNTAPGLLVISGRPLTHCEGGMPQTEGPEEDRDEVLNPAMECSYGECRRRQMGRRGVDEDTDQKVDRDDNAPSAKERPDKVHPTSSLRTLELRDLAVDKSSATS